MFIEGLVFLVSRMHEESTLTDDSKRAVIRGQAETGRVITAASLIMIVVFASFIFGGQLEGPSTKQDRLLAGPCHITTMEGYSWLHHTRLTKPAFDS